MDPATVMVASHRREQHPGLAKLPMAEAKIASTLKKGQAVP